MNNSMETVCAFADERDTCGTMQWNKNGGRESGGRRERERVAVRIHWVAQT